MCISGLQVHYLGSPGRGTVWEEVIIHCPTTIQMLAMSATVANPEDLGAWIRKVGPTHPTQAAGHAKEFLLSGVSGCCGSRSLLSAGPPDHVACYKCK